MTTKERVVGVAYVASSAEIGGGNRSLLDLIQGLTQFHGHEFDSRVIVPAQGPMSELCAKRGIQCTIMRYVSPDRSRPWKSFGAALAASKALGDCAADLVHANDPYSARSVSLGAMLRRIPLISHVRMPIGEEAAPWLFRGLKRPAGFIFNSETLLRDCGPSLRASVPGAWQRVVLNPVDLSRFSPSPERRGARLTVLNIGNISPVKRQDIFVRVAAEVGRVRPDVRFVLAGRDIGTGEHERSLRELARREAPRLEFLGACDNVPELMAQADVVVSTSEYESFGRTILEAMASGVPVVATAVGGVPEVCGGDETALLVAPGDASAVSSALIKLIDSAELRRRLSENGRKRALRFDLRLHADAVGSLYRRALGALEVTG